MTRDLYNLNLFAKLMVLLRQILFNPAIAAVAEAILMRISADCPEISEVVDVSDLVDQEQSCLWSDGTCRNRSTELTVQHFVQGRLSLCLAVRTAVVRKSCTSSDARH